MEILSQFGIWGGGWTGWIVPFLFGLSVVVFFHELGHFLVARWCGVRVEAFSIGFGPELFGFNDRQGTRWKLAAIPLGGYVKFLGDENAASVPDQAAVAAMPEDERRHSFFHQPVGARAAIVAAGPLANFFVAIVIFAGVFVFYGKPSTAARVDMVQPGSAAAVAGFQPGDVVLSIDDRTISRFTEMQQIVRASAGRTSDCRDRSRWRPANPDRSAGPAGDQGPASAIPSASASSGSPTQACLRSEQSFHRPLARHHGDLEPDRTDDELCRAGSLFAGKQPISSAGRSELPRFRGRWQRWDLFPSSASSPSCRSRLASSTCFPFRYSMAATFSFTVSKRFGGGRYRCGYKKSVSELGLLSCSCWSFSSPTMTSWR